MLSYLVFNYGKALVKSEVLFIKIPTNFHFQLITDQKGYT